MEVTSGVWHYLTSLPVWVFFGSVVILVLYSKYRRRQQPHWSKLLLEKRPLTREELERLRKETQQPSYQRDSYRWMDTEDRKRIKRDKRSIKLSPRFDSNLLIRTSITMAVLAASLFVILATRYTPTDKHWGYATVGTILGYWLKGK